MEWKRIWSRLEYNLWIESGKETIIEYSNRGDEAKKYEGEYLNGVRHGEGKEYDSEGNLIFEDKFDDRKRNGYRKEYEGDFIFKDEYLNRDK